MTGRRDAGRREAGFALIIVLWGLVLAGLLVGHLVAAGRTQSRIAANELGGSEAQAAADGGVHVAIYHLMRADLQDRWRADGLRHDVKIGDAEVEVRVWDQAGLINPNLAPPELLALLFRECGAGQSQAAALAQAVVSWREPAPQPGGVGEMDYRAAGLGYAPPGAPFESLDELGRVLGMTPALLAAARPHLSLFNTLEYPDPRAADPLVARLLAQSGKADDRQTTALPAARTTVTIRAEARGARGGRFVRRAVIAIGPGPLKGFKTLEWEQLAD